MNKNAWWVGVTVLLAAPAALAPGARLAAQGVTSAAVNGRLTDESGASVEQAVVTLINASNGQRYSTRSSADGRYFFENVQVGGPYTIEVRALGFAPAQASAITLALGQRLVRDFSLKRTAVEVAGITVSANANPLLSPNRTGAAGTVPSDVITRLPTLGRNFTDFINTIPQVVSAGVPGTSLGGQNNRFNNIQIDGGVNNDLFGLAASGTPGGQANAHPISVEAIKEYQVLIAPFDVREGGFAGGLVNAVTKSGTNAFHGSIFAYLQNQSFVQDTVFQLPRQTDFTQSQYGGSVSGPIVRDRLQFFGSVDLQHRVAPFTGLVIGSNPVGGADSLGIGITYATATRVQQILSSKYGFDPGGVGAPDIRNPDKNIFAKLNGELSPNHHAELSYNYVDASQDVLTHNPTATGFRDGYQLSSSGYLFSTTTNTLRGKISSTLPRGASNELLLGYQRIRDHRDLPNRASLIFVGGDRGQPVGPTQVPATNIAAGADRFSQGNLLNQDVYEITDNLTVPFKNHLVTIGTHNEFFHFFNVFFPASYGVWSFRDTTALLAATPFRYEIALPLRPGGPNADFHVKQLGGYVQDVWAPRSGLSVTIGLRVDVPLMDKPPHNPVADSILGANTANSPTGNTLWSPRIGFNYDVNGDQSTLLRGGVGIFSGRPPYVWVSNAFSNTGLEQATLVCDGPFSTTNGTLDTVPRFRVNPDSQPKACGSEGSGSVGLAAARPSVVYFDQGFKLPQNLKAALGVDHQLPWGMVGTFDFLYTRGLNQFYMYDVNLSGVVGTAAGEGGRPLYGTVNPATGVFTPSRLTTSFNDVLRHTNRSGDYSYSFTGQIQKRFSNGVQFNVAYTYGRSYDLISLGSSIASSNYRFTTLDGPITARNLAPSVFDIPHKITASGTVNLKYGIALSAVYIGQSGSRYGYVVSNDANGEGFGGNDLVYVPRDSADISLLTPSDWSRLDAYIKSEPCLERSRGRILSRNSCQNPWTNFLNLRLAKAFTTLQGQNVELTADLFNTFSLLDNIGIRNTWGAIKQVSGFENDNLLQLRRYDTVNQRGVYSLNTSNMPIKERNSDASRWRLQVGLKYSF
jgi:carboxypeptidase family protein